MQTSNLSDEHAVQSNPGHPRRVQIGLRGMFACTSYFAIASLLASWQGISTFVLMNGALLTWLSHRGRLWFCQTKKTRPRLFGVGWLIVAVSFVLPAVTFQGCGSGQPSTYYGWQAAVSAVSMSGGVIRDAKNVAIDPQQRTWQVRELAAGFLMFLLWNLPNLLLLASPFILYRQQRGKGALLTSLLCCAAACSWMWGLANTRDLRIGYYLWSSGITLLSLGRPPGGKTLVAMLLVGIGWAWIGFGR